MIIPLKITTTFNPPTFQTVKIDWSLILTQHIVSPYLEMQGNGGQVGSPIIHHRGLNQDNSIGDGDDNTTDQYILKNLDSQSDIEPSDNVFDDEEEMGDEEEDEDDPEALAELEKRKEEILEEFLEIAIQKRYEAVEEVKAECKRDKIAKDLEKKRVLEVQQTLDAKRKDGIKEIKKKMALIVDNDSIPLKEKIERLQDTEQIKAFILAHFATGEEATALEGDSTEEPQLQE